jgi:natural product biosynthesis luciferase-like monooxygenase protein
MVKGALGGRRCAFVGDEALVAQCVQIAQAHDLIPVLLATKSAIVRDFAAEHGIPVVGHGDELAAGLDQHPADVLFSIANEQAVPSEVLDRVGLTIHLHDGPVPTYLGVNVTTWAILRGESEHAITWYLLPGGEILATETFPIADDDTAFSLNVRCYEAAVRSFAEIAAAVSRGQVDETAPSEGEARTYTHRDRPAVLLDPAVPAEQAARAVRALDVGHRSANSVGAVRWLVGDEVYVVDSAHVHHESSNATPGTVVSLPTRDGGSDDGSPSGIRIATTDGDLVVDALSTPEGATVDLTEAVSSHGFAVGDVVAAPDPALSAALVELEPDLAVDEGFWLDRLAVADPTPSAVAARPGRARARRTIDLPPQFDQSAAVAVVALWLTRTTGAETLGFGVTGPASRAILERLAPLARPGVLTVSINPAGPFTDLVSTVATEVEASRERAPLLRDALGRDPRTRGRAAPSPVVVDLDVASPNGASSRSTRIGADEPPLRVAIGAGTVVLDAVSDPTDPDALDRVAEQISTLMASTAENPRARCDALPILGSAETASLDAFNRTDLDHDRAATVDGLFRAQVARTPDAPALSFRELTLTYRELHERVQVLAARLSAAGVGSGDRVGIATERGVDMVVGVLAALEIGASYLPLDPSYPTERLAFMIDDAGIVALLADAGGPVRPPDVTVIDPVGPDAAPGPPPASPHGPADLAYVIYTSGSTGVPKGVMLEHRQVTNFFAAMDEVIDHDPPGVWLAVTSLSFDISVLELLWTLTRGFHVVLKADSGIAAPSPDRPRMPAPHRPAAGTVSFSLFYFAAGEEAAADGYRLLLESARFADRNGFEAVWTPERHFHAFGGAYPNPSVTGAALAAITENVGIRAGSVVLPLHSPIRVAEEWAVVDNLSKGRVALSFAAGWQPNDFVLNPTAYATAKEDLPRNIETVQRLWRGETVALPGHDGEPVDVGTLPRPLQAELPVWLTSAGSPATFERAGTLGVNVLTHLLGQSVEQVAENITRYRTAWRDAGHEGEGRVTLMMHTYLDRDADTAREVAREPMKGYLRSSVGLLRNVATAFPIFADSGRDADDLLASLSAEELDQLLEMAAQRYLGTSGLFGTPEDVAAFVSQLGDAGVDEVACLIDFGVPTEEALASLDLLLEAKNHVEARSDRAAPSVPPPDDRMAALTDRHGVTHVQCTPSLAAMLAADPADRAALATVSHMMVGGEALPAALAADLRALLPGRFTNMYGPTETTIWSLTHEIVDAPEGSVPIGRPVANTTVMVLDSTGNRVPFQTYGELHIGGEGVARGYHNRPELTAERFVDREGLGRMYATGDVVRIRPDGDVEFAGRVDNQVKVRGHRIELGEIESVLDRHPDVLQSVVVADDDHGDTRLVAYVVSENGAEPDVGQLRQYVADALPTAMVPSTVVCLDAFPLTPNGKVDRKRLPTTGVSSRVAVVVAPPVDDTEKLVADIWSDELGCPVGRDDNFFDIGGHSLLAVKVFRRVGEKTGAPLALTDVFQFPTVRTFAAHLSEAMGAPTSGEPARAAGGPAGGDRGAMRRRALARRGRGADQGDGR